MNQITTQHLIIRTIQTNDLQTFKAFEQRNKDHLALCSPVYSFSDDEYQKLIDCWVKEQEEGKAVRFFLCAKDDPQEQVIGLCNFTNIVRGPFQACYLGYKIDHAYEGKGLMFEALQAAIAYMFAQLNLHRIMANYMPSNTRSAKLLARLGFVIEGTAKNYLLINNRWEDHILTARINTNWRKDGY